MLLGDYLYAHGLVRIAELGEVDVVADLAELLSLCAQARADGLAWAGTVACLGTGDERLAKARAALRDGGDTSPLARLAEARAGESSVAQALALHRSRV